VNKLSSTKILKKKEFAHFAYFHPCTVALHFWHKTLLVRRKYEKATNAKRHGALRANGRIGIAAHRAA
jgi:hypothetical protein